MRFSKYHSCVLYHHTTNTLIHLKGLMVQSGLRLLNIAGGKEKSHIRLTGVTLSSRNISFSAAIQISLPSPQISEIHFPLHFHQKISSYRISQKGAHLHFQHHKLTSPSISPYRKRRVPLPYLRLNLSATPCVSSLLPHPESLCFLSRLSLIH